MEEEKNTQHTELEGQQPVQAKKKRSLAARFLRWVCILLLSPIILFLVLAVLLYIPFIQDWAVGIACEKISESTHLDVKVERVRISFPLDLDLQKLCITQPGNPADTVLAVNSCIVDLDMCGLLGGKIGVDALDLNGVVADTHLLLPSLIVKGRLQDFHLDVHDLEFSNNRVYVTGAALDGCDLDIALRDTTIIDTTTSKPLPWKVDFRNIELNDTRLAFHTANDTMSVFADVEQMSLRKGRFNMALGLLHLEDLDLKADSLHYDLNYTPRQAGLDFGHIALYDLDTQVDKVDYNMPDGKLCAVLPRMQVHEKSGFRLDDLALDFCLDTLGIQIDKARLKTPTSELRAQADVPWSALQPDGKGTLEAKLSADISRHDFFMLAGPYLPADVRKNYPDRMLTARVDVAGNMNYLDVSACSVKIPGVIDAKVQGNAANLLSDGVLGADLKWDVHTLDLSLIRSLAGLDGIKLPPMDLTGTTRLGKDVWQASLLLKQGHGSLKVDGTYNPNTDAYKALLDARSFAVSNFVPMDSACIVTARAKVDGRGYDLFSGRTRLEALLDMPHASYGSSNIGDVHVDARLAHQNFLVNFYSGGDLVCGDGCIELQLQKNRIDSAAFTFDMRGLDLYTLGVTKKPFKAAMSMHMQANSNLHDTHYVKGDVSAMEITLKDTTFYPRDITLETYLNPDTTYAFLSAGDLLFRLNSTDGLSELIDKSTAFADSIGVQMVQKHFDKRGLLGQLPTADLCIQSGSRNPFANILYSMMGYSYNDLDVDLHVSPQEGLKGEGFVHSTNTGSIVLDTIRFDLRLDSLETVLNAQVRNSKKNKDVTFDSRLHANLTPGKIDLGLLYFDSQNRKGVDLGAEVVFSNGSRRIHLTPLRPIIAYRYFTLNEDNFVLLDKDGRIEAGLDMLADDGTGLKLYSTPNEDADQDLTLSLNRLNLGELSAVMPYLPRISGFLHGDLHLTQQQSITSIMADLTAANMAYEGSPMGDIGVNAAYMPNSDGSHFVDGYLTQNEREVLSFTGTYADQGSQDNLDAEVSFQRFPLSIANGFVGESMQLAGSLLGQVNVTGSTSRPRVDGSIVTDSMHILAPLYSINMRIQDDSIKVANSRLNLNKLKGYTIGTTPLTLDGYLDFADFGNMLLDIRAKASNFELINAPKNRKAAAYGKVFVDLDARARGSLQNLDLTGKLGVLGNTNVTYVLLDSPITVEDEMSDLVTFCDFSDTIEVEEPDIVPPSNLNMRFQIAIDQRANVNCLLSPDGANYVKLEGGGDLNMTYNPAKGMQMTGRYTILQGKMTYTLMVVSLADCQIKNGSYVEFAGDISNPRLKIDATERINSTITQNETPRNVAFDVGLSISQTLSNMGLAFTLDAPEDLNVQNDLTQMTAEQRNMAAVTLLTTGMFIVDGQESGGYNTTNALNSFLQSQISSITGKALNTFDLSLGMQNSTTASGNVTTDYSFRFAKRFWGNRISLIVGGKVSSGVEARNTEETIIDNISIEYRLDKSATRYVNLFYNTNSESVLEGRITQMGAGLVLRRKTNRLGELFLFRTPKKEEEGVAE